MYCLSAPGLTVASLRDRAGISPAVGRPVQCDTRALWFNQGSDRKAFEGRSIKLRSIP